MATERRPSRPITRVPQKGEGAVHTAPTTRMPQKPSGGPPTRMGGRAGTSRTGRADQAGHGTRAVPSSKKSNLPVILGASGGGLLLIILVVVLASGGTSGSSPASNKKKSGPVVPDVSSLERDAEAKCEQGLTIIQKCEGLMTGRTLNAGEKTQLSGDLGRGLALMVDGMNKYDQANSKSGNTYDVVKYSKAMKAARMKLGELK